MRSGHILKAEPQDFLEERMWGVKVRKNTRATTKFLSLEPGITELTSVVPQMGQVWVGKASVFNMLTVKCLLVFSSEDVAETAEYTSLEFERSRHGDKSMKIASLWVIFKDLRINESAQEGSIYADKKRTKNSHAVLLLHAQGKWEHPAKESEN